MNNINNSILQPSGTIKSMSFYRMSDAPPNWAQQDPTQPDYIANKSLAEQLRPIFVNGQQVLDSTHESGPLNFIAGTNIAIIADGNSITISAEIPENNDEKIIQLIAAEHERAVKVEEQLSQNIIALTSFVNEEFEKTNTQVEKNVQTIVAMSKKFDIGSETIASYVAKEIEKVNSFGAPIATEETLGVVKLSKQIGVDDQGALKINYITTDDIVQGESMWILNGGDESVIPN